MATFKRVRRRVISVAEPLGQPPGFRVSREAPGAAAGHERLPLQGKFTEIDREEFYERTWIANGNLDV